MLKLLSAVLKLLSAVLKLLSAVLKLLSAVLKLLSAVLKLLIGDERQRLKSDSLGHYTIDMSEGIPNTELLGKYL